MSELEQFCESEERNGHITCKCISKSVEFRKEGNILYNNNKKKKNDEITNRTILTYYSKSIAYAPLNCEELALTYSNRSVLWYHFHRYDLCLIDVNRALSITKSNELKTSLLSRKKKCLDFKQSVSNNCKDYKIPELSEHNASKNISCGADSITMKQSEKYGRHYVATRDIRPGEIVIIEESSYAAVNNHQLYLVCSHCLAFAWACVPCDFCVFAIYCSENCKNQAWSEYHDVMCSILPLLYSVTFKNVDMCSVIAMVRVVVIAIKKKGLEGLLKETEDSDAEKDMNLEKLLSAGKLNCRNFRSVYNLMSYEDNEVNEGLNDCISVLLSLMCKSSIIFQTQSNKNGLTLTSMRKALEKLYKIHLLNTYTFNDFNCFCNDSESCRTNCTSDRGIILAPCSSLINHSCDRNVSRIFLPGPKIVIYSICPIKKGEQIFDSYGPYVSMRKELRQKLVMESHRFTCECKPCIENWSTNPDDLDTEMPESQMIYSQFFEIFGRHYQMFTQDPKVWMYNEKLFRACIKMSIQSINNTARSKIAYLAVYQCWMDIQE
ncbi:hypothetical protein QAD02_015713, partial [Eretmocerus hayati]